ncbi:hypothetical protein V1478_003139 [Vespula squamosa]|uniref:Uncharacterized protein n=1 Tax=Vespula squamosa TaxID=30214 RepID=A0ABD2BRU2_VESSQ
MEEEYQERCCFRQISSLERRRREFAGRKIGSSLKNEIRRERMKLLENGEMLGYIDLVLKQLRKASRDHRLLVEQRHLRDSPTFERHRFFEVPTSSSVYTRDWIKNRTKREEMQEELLEYHPRAATRLLTKRKTYVDREEEEKRGGTYGYGKSRGAFERIVESSSCRDPNYVLDQEGFERKLFDRQLFDWTGRSSTGTSTVV